MDVRSGSCMQMSIGCLYALIHLRISKSFVKICVLLCFISHAAKCVHLIANRITTVLQFCITLQFLRSPSSALKIALHEGGGGAAALASGESSTSAIVGNSVGLERN